jgi:hypothetical protein
MNSNAAVRGKEATMSSDRVSERVKEEAVATASNISRKRKRKKKYKSPPGGRETPSERVEKEASTAASDVAGKRKRKKYKSLPGERETPFERVATAAVAVTSRTAAKKLKVAGLRAELSRRGMDYKGTRPVLFARLIDEMTRESGGVVQPRVPAAAGLPSKVITPYELQYGPQYCQLGTGKSEEELKKGIQQSTGLPSTTITLQRIYWRGVRGANGKCCNVLPSRILKASPGEDLRVLFKVQPNQDNDDEKEDMLFSAVALIRWRDPELFPHDYCHLLRRELVHLLTMYGEPQRRGNHQCGKCTCNGEDATGGASYTTGCSWSSFTKGCKWGFSNYENTGPQPFFLKHGEEKDMRQLEAWLVPAANKVGYSTFQHAPLAHKKMVASLGSDCHYGNKESPFGGLTVTVDYAAHAHRDIANLPGAVTVVLSLLKDQEIKEEEKEQSIVHILLGYELEENGGRDEENVNGDGDGVAIGLPHGSQLFEVALQEVHATSRAIPSPNRCDPARTALVFYQHHSLGKDNHSTMKIEGKPKSPQKKPKEEHTVPVVGISGQLRSHVFQEFQDTVENNSSFFSCDICCETFRNSYLVKQHKKIKHGGNREHMCDKCGLMCVDGGQLSHHQNTVHASGGPSKCLICGRMYKTEVHMLAHAKKTHI